MSTVENYIQTNGIRLHYLDHAGGEPVLVLLPGLTANCHAFDGYVQAGLSPRWRVIAPDLRGRGESDQPSTGYTMADHAADIVGMLDALGLQQVVLGGHSFGGFLTLYLAAHYPERFERLILLDAGLAMASARTRAQIQPAIDRLGKVSPSWEAYLAAIQNAPYYAGWWDPGIEPYYRADVRTNADGSVQARSRPETIAAASDGLLAVPWRDLIAGITQPTLLVHAPGAYGPAGAPPILSTPDAQETVALLGNCTYAQVEGNHMTMLFGNGARQTVAAIDSFLQ